VAAGEFGDPVAGIVLMKAGDGSVHGAHMNAGSGFQNSRPRLNE